ncbi:MAG: ROK family protein [Anaerolineales bacterium]|nr:ROK family protein [Anaerolineales bacterium]
MKDFLGSNIVNVKAHNMQTVLLSLLTCVDSVGQQLLSRSQLAQKTNLSSTTITNLVAELIEQGIVAEDKNAREDEHRSIGRPRTGLYLIPDARYVVGVHIGVGLYRVAVMNLRAEIVCSKLVTFAITTPSADILREMSLDIHELLTNCGVDRRLILGVGVGASGLVDYLKGINILAPNLDWHHVPIRDYLESQLGLPGVVENNVRAMALGEAYFGGGREAQSLAFVYGRTGVGAGFVIDHQLFRGSSTGAGEIGHMILVSENGELCRCGNRGCLETLVSEAVIIRRAQGIAEAEPDGVLAHLLANPADRSLVECVFQAARQGDSAVLQLLGEIGHYLGVALTNLVNILNPEMIILGGLFAQAEDLILPVARETLNRLAFAGIGEKVKLTTTGFGWRAGVTGAAALALLAFFYRQPAIAPLPTIGASLSNTFILTR